MLIKVLEKVSQPIDVEVDFPIYREQDVSGERYSCVIFSRITSDMEVFSITENDDGFELKTEKANFLDGSPSDYWLGRGLYQSSEQAFRSARTRAEQFLNEAFTDPE